MSKLQAIFFSFLLLPAPKDHLLTEEIHRHKWSSAELCEVQIKMGKKMGLATKSSSYLVTHKPLKHITNWKL